MAQPETTVVVLMGVIAFGLLHGINPSHGWTVAVLYSIRSRRPLLSSLASSGIIAGAHFLSSIAVVIAFLLVTMFVQIPHDYVNYAAAIALGVLAYMFWKEKSEDLAETQHGHLHGSSSSSSLSSKQVEHEHAHWHKGTGYHSHIHIHQKRVSPSLAAIAGLALVLGFAHEEEFVILSLAVGGVNPVLLMIAYASSVAAALIGVTVLAVKVYTRVQNKVLQYTKYLPKASALILSVMAAGFALGLL
ncbi:nickel/cobalt transporter [Nitrososphaera viennensis]|uniref:Nickel/cobalt transporter n=2 Tax=Nitrososphaera viennensis TaxID=1034015 RepID=A0A977NMK9_9ARCH|nr:nickel/cobalt transporter [Nitrososphaera viennensis]UVS68960.1 nickel/cobalt transporter [Nitrososphaera viennensis]